MGFNGKTGATESSFLHFNACVFVSVVQNCRCLYLLSLDDAGIYYEIKHRVQPCHVVSNHIDIHSSIKINLITVVMQSMKIATHFIRRTRLQKNPQLFY